MASMQRLFEIDVYNVQGEKVSVSWLLGSKITLKRRRSCWESWMNLGVCWFQQDPFTRKVFKDSPVTAYRSEGTRIFLTILIAFHNPHHHLKTMPLLGLLAVIVGEATLALMSPTTLILIYRAPEDSSTSPSISVALHPISFMSSCALNVRYYMSEKLCNLDGFPDAPCTINVSTKKL